MITCDISISHQQGKLNLQYINMIFKNIILVQYYYSNEFIKECGITLILNMFNLQVIFTMTKECNIKNIIFDVAFCISIASQ